MISAVIFGGKFEMSESTLTEPATIELIISTSVKFLTHLSNTFNEKNKLKKP